MNSETSSYFVPVTSYVGNELAGPVAWPKIFKRFIDDGFGVIKSNKKRIFAMGK